jgi:hypothetical protein
MNPLEQFRCVPLQCRLLRKSCGERFVRAEALQKDSEGHWIPSRWADLAHNCRGCKIGEVHADLLGVERPQMPLSFTRKQPAIVHKNCEACKQVFRPTSNRQQKCPQCSTSRRFARLKKEHKAVCSGCGKTFPTLLGLRLCAACGRKQEDWEKNETKRGSNLHSRDSVFAASERPTTDTGEGLDRRG